MVGEKIMIFTQNACNMNDMVCNIHDVCGRQWHILLAEVRNI